MPCRPFIDETIRADDLVEHHLDVLAGVPVAVVVEAPALLEHARKLDAARAHVVDVRLRGGVAVLEGPLLFRLAPEDLVVAIAVERRVGVDQVHAAVGQLAELVQAVAAIDDARIEQGRRPPGARGARAGLSLGTFPRRAIRHSLHAPIVALAVSLYP
jgi:hypothetical protein